MSANLASPIYHDEEAARKHLEGLRWPHGVACPFCQKNEGVRALGGKSMGDGWYHCRVCRKKFTVRVGSVFERSHIPLHKWLLAFRLMAGSKKGFSAHQLHRSLGVTYKTAWFMEHRIREAMTESDPRPLGGEGKTVEVDETFIGPQGWELHDNGWQRKRGTGDKAKVVSLVERGGRVRSVKVETIRVADIRKTVLTHLSIDTNLVTDEAHHYRHVGRLYASHETVNHSKHEYGRGHVYTNTVEGFFSIFKRGMTGIYQHCSEKHLQRYLNEFDFRYSNRIALGTNDASRTDAALIGAIGKRLYYRQPHGIRSL